MKSKLALILTVILFCGFSFRNNSEVKPAKILTQMFDSIKGIKTLRQSVHAIERIENHFNTSFSEIKLQTSPRKLYYHNKLKKIEILYNAETSLHKAYVKPHVFPYLTLSLDPSGNIMRKNQHYSINELGYDFIGKSVALTIKKDKDGINKFTYLGKVVKNGYTCYFLEYENKSYNYTPYVVGDRETASLISYKLCVNDYLLRNKNNLLNEFGYIKKGSVLHVPTLYCQKAILYIDERLMLPVCLSLYDDAGLFESYEYTGIELNKPFQKEEFTKDYKGYGF